LICIKLSSQWRRQFAAKRQPNCWVDQSLIKVHAMAMNLNSRGMRRATLVLFTLAAFATLWFGLRTYGSFLLLRSAYEAGAPTTSSIRPWMTLNYVAVAYRRPVALLIERLGLPSETDSNMTLKTIAEQRGLSPYQFIQHVQRAVAGVASNSNSNGTADTPGWLGVIGDEVLSAVLTYGYPALGLTLLLGAIGFPLPDGLATTVAGSLAAQGRMSWFWAGAVTVSASVVGDAVVYGVGRVVSREVLERHGHWLGYTPVRRVQVQLLFDQWGSVTVFVTRTFVSYLSSVAGLLAGVSHYRMSKFLAIAVVGRVMWTSAYLGLGYVIGASLEAATGFLTNLTGFLLSLTVLAGSGLVASGRALIWSKRKMQYE
jgi:membrane protein DedA with SNARE-associated domain